MSHVLQYGTLSQKLEYISTHLSLTETDESWDKIAKATSDLAKLTEIHGAEQSELILDTCKAHSRHLINAMNSERTRLSGAAIDSVASIATSLGSSFDPLVPHLFPSVLHLCSRANKVTITRSKACVLAIIEATHHPSVISHFLANIKDKSVTLRLMSAEGTLACLNSLNPPDLERGSRPTELEGIIRAAAADASADVRKIGKQLWEAYKIVLPSRVDAFIAPLSPTIRKYLNIKDQPPRLPSSSSSTSSRDPGHRAVTRSVSQPKGVQLSSSMSALRQDNINQGSHNRAASVDVPAVGRGDKKKPVADMLPPALVPSRPVRSQAQAPPAHQRTTSAGSSGSAAPQRPTTSRPNSRAGDAPTRPDLGPRRAPTPSGVAEPGNAGRQPQRFTVPIPKRTELQEAEKGEEPKPKGPVRAVRAPPAAGPSEPKRPALPSQPSADAIPKAAGETSAVTKPSGTERERFRPVSSAAKAAASKASSGGVTRPTQSQLARAQAATQVQAQKHQVAPSKTRPKVHPKDIPLPPSPKAKAKTIADPPKAKTTAAPRVHPKDVPLPPSPKAKARAITDPQKKSAPPTHAPITKKPASGNPPSFKPVSKTKAAVPPPPRSGATSKNMPVKNRVPDKNRKPKDIPLPPSPEPQVEVKSEVAPVQEEIIPPKEEVKEETEAILPSEQVMEEAPLKEQESAPLIQEVQDQHDESDEEQDMELVSDDELVHAVDARANESGEAVVEASPADLGEVILPDVEEPNIESGEDQLASPARPPPASVAAKTPISSLLSSIEQGFMFTPPSPLSPPEHYANIPRPLAIPFPLNLSGNRNPKEHGVKGTFTHDKGVERGVLEELESN